MFPIEIQFHHRSMKLDAEMQLNTESIQLDVAFADYQEVTIQKEADRYTGEYEITPAIEAQILRTSQKLMKQDVTIKAIPYFETSNDFDGKTVYIGSEVEIYGD